MRYYYAPLEGITDATFRTLHHKYFPGVDRYFMPFISPTIHRCLTNREARELPKADSVPFTAVPQLLGRNVEDMLWALEVSPFYGSDVEATLRSGVDIRHGLIGAGVYASHGYERSHIDGVYNTLKVLAGYLGV